MFDTPIRLDLDGLERNLRRQGTPDRTYYLELFLDEEIEDAICVRYDLAAGLDPADPHFRWRRKSALYRFLGYETLPYSLPGFSFPMTTNQQAADTAGLQRNGGRGWLNEHHGEITSWADFERYPWPQARNYDLRELEWLEKNLPDDQALAPHCHSILEIVTWLMGYESLCFALYDQPDLVDAMFKRVGELHVEAAEILLQFPRVRLMFGGDDMGFKTSLMLPAKVLIEKSFPWHARLAAATHARGRLYLLHACGQLKEVMPALLDQVKIDGRHSFEDTIEPVTEAKKTWGKRVALLGGIDVDFLCRASEEQIRARVRRTLDVCLPGGGYCLGSGNTVANYIPVENYLAMMDEGRKYTA